jgi:hypothetical protein
MIKCLAHAITLLISPAIAYAGMVPAHNEQFVRIAALLDKSAVVCKGEVVQASTPKVITTGEIPRGTGIAVIQVDRCFKGSAPTQAQIATDEYLPAAGAGVWTLLVPKAGEYGIFFFSSNGPVLKPLEHMTSFVPTSRILAAHDVAGTPTARLEADLLAGLNDPDYDLRLQIIHSLGTLDPLSRLSISRLTQMLRDADELEKLYLWEALITAHQYSELPDAANEVLFTALRSREFFLPRDRIPFMQFRVYDAICLIKDPVVVPYMRKLSESPDPRSRYDAVQSLRTQHDQCSAPVFLKALDDHGQDGFTAFSAMHSLYELADTGPGWEMIPGPEDFVRDGASAAAVRSWWETVGETTAKKVRTNICVPQPNTQY